MIRRVVPCLLLLCLASPGELHGDGASSPTVHIWRGEYEHALSEIPDGSGLDRVAFLTMAGDIEGASSLLGSIDDPFRSGLIAYKGGRFFEASNLLQCEMKNPYLEVYRRYWRAVSLVHCSRYEAAEGELQGVFSLVDIDSTLTCHPVLADAQNLFVEAACLTPGGDSLLGEVMKRTGMLSGRSYFILAKASLRNGHRVDAKNWFMMGIHAEPDTAGVTLFGELLRLFQPELQEVTLEEILTVAEAAVAFGYMDEADTLIHRLCRNYPQEGRVFLLKGRYSRRSGYPRRALKIYRRLFSSQASVAEKKEALLRMASLQYRLKDYRKAAESYRLFGMYYPGDDRSNFALDTAARLEVLRKQWSNALTIWSTLRKRGVVTELAKEAALSEAVLRYRLGNRRTSSVILKRLLPDVGERLEPAVLYWLHRTGATVNERNKWAERLKTRYPISFYALVLQKDKRSMLLTVDLDETNLESLSIEEIERRERELFDEVGESLPHDDSLFTHPGYQAFVYFIDRGFLEEASQCGEVIKSIFRTSSPRLSVVYGKARSKGMIHLGLSLLSSPALSGSHHAILSYPAAFTSTVQREARANYLPAELILAVIREESRFDRCAISRAGAMGLMQLMPSTGSWIGRKLGDAYNGTDDLLNPSCNIAAGSWYLRYLLDRVGGSLVAALAAYNGGETRTAGWRKTFKPLENPMISIELIGLSETRNYVRRILNSLAAYRSLSRMNVEL